MEAALKTRGMAETYERVLVPTIFAPWAQEILERARPIGPSDRVLDLGCGTGIVARLLRERLGVAARITGLDARDQRPQHGARAPETLREEQRRVRLVERLGRQLSTDDAMLVRAVFGIQRHLARA